MDKQLDATNLNLHNNQNENVVPLDKFLLVTMEQLDEEIKNIAVHKSSGIHNLSSYVVKMCFKVLSVQILAIINDSLFQGYFLVEWRRATVVPIPKVNIPKEIGDFRLIALKPIFHCNANDLAWGVGVGQCPRRQNFALEIPTCWYILALPNAKKLRHPRRET